MTNSRSFDFEDFLSSMRRMRRINPVWWVLTLVPPLRRYREIFVLPPETESEGRRIEAMIGSMTSFERRNAQAIGDSRAFRIAQGSGTSARDVIDMVRQFVSMQQYNA